MTRPSRPLAAFRLGTLTNFFRSSADEVRLARTREVSVIPKPVRHHRIDQLACVGVACACALLIGLFVWLIVESLLGLR
jgi:hypothetical protein